MSLLSVMMKSIVDEQDDVDEAFSALTNLSYLFRGIYGIEVTPLETQPSKIVARITFSIYRTGHPSE